jgi:hypothetical protein
MLQPEGVIAVGANRDYAGLPEHERIARGGHDGRRSESGVPLIDLHTG